MYDNITGTADFVNTVVVVSRTQDGPTARGVLRGVDAYGVVLDAVAIDASSLGMGWMPRGNAPFMIPWKAIRSITQASE